MITIGCDLDDATTPMRRERIGVLGGFGDALAARTRVYHRDVQVCEHVFKLTVFWQERPAEIVTEALRGDERRRWQEFIRDPEPGPLETM